MDFPLVAGNDPFHVFPKHAERMPREDGVKDFFFRAIHQESLSEGFDNVANVGKELE